MSESHELPFAFDEAFVRTAMKRDFWDRAWVGTGLLVLAAVIMCMVMGAAPPSVLAIFGVGIVIVWVLILSTLRRSARQVVSFWERQAPDRTMRFLFNEEGFEVHIGSTHTSHAWAGLRRLWRYPDVWIIEMVKNVSVFFPPESASHEILAFVESRCRQAGVRV